MFTFYMVLKFKLIENLSIHHLQCDKCNQWMPVKVVSSVSCIECLNKTNKL